MTYEEIDAYLQATGLVNEPAFEYLHFLTEDIPPRENARILGLYFPQGERHGQPFGYLPPSTIILPANASEYTLLHELGHRYGDYYYNDITEAFAEQWAQAHYKEATMVARSVPYQSGVSGQVIIDMAPEYEAILAEEATPEGMLEIRAYMTAPATAEDLALVQDTLIANGIQVVSVNSGFANGYDCIVVRYRKEEPPVIEGAAMQLALVIPLISTALIVGLIAYGIARISTVSEALLPLTLVVVGGAAIIAALARGPAMRYVERH